MSIHLKQRQQVQNVERFLICTYEDAQASSRWLSRQSIGLQVLANQKAIEIYIIEKNRNLEISKEIISIACNLKTAHMIHDLYKKAHRKNSNFTSDDIVILDALEVNNFLILKRAAKKRDFLQRRMSQILNWKTLGVSYADIESKLITIDGDTISAEYIRKTVNAHKDIS